MEPKSIARNLGILLMNSNCFAIGGIQKAPVQRTWWSVIQKNLIRI